MSARGKTYWRVRLGRGSIYFPDEQDARDYAKDRASDPDNWDGLPFLDEINERELMVRINQLEASK